MIDPNRRQFIKQSLLALSGVAALAAHPTVTQAIPPIIRGVDPQMKASLSAYSFRKYLNDPDPYTMNMDGFLYECAQMGLDAAEPTSYYFPKYPLEEYFIRYKRRAFMLGLDISATAIGNEFTYPPGPQRDKQLEYCREWVDYAAIFGAPCIRIFAGRVRDGANERQARQYSIDTIQEACEYAGTKGIILALENHGGIVSDAEGLLAIVDEVDSEWFGVNLDTGNFHTSDPYKEIEKAAPYAVNVQIKVEMWSDSNQKYEADFDRIVDIIGEAGYRGYVALEYESNEEPMEAVPRYIEKLQKALAKA